MLDLVVFKTGQIPRIELFRKFVRLLHINYPKLLPKSYFFKKSNAKSL